MSSLGCPETAFNLASACIAVKFNVSKQRAKDFLRETFPGKVPMPEPLVLRPKRVVVAPINKGPAPITYNILIDDIVNAVCEAMNVKAVHIYGGRKDALVAIPRAICFYIGYHHTNRSPHEIGLKMNRAGKTVRHGIRRIAQLMANDPELTAKVDDIIAEVKRCANGPITFDERQNIRAAIGRDKSPANLARVAREFGRGVTTIGKIARCAA